MIPMVLNGSAARASLVLFFERTVSTLSDRLELPSVIVRKLFQRLPFWRSKLDGWIPKIDQTGYLDMVRHPEYPLYLRFAPGRSGPVDRQACSQSHSMSREHQVLHCWKDTGIADLLALAYPVQVYAAVDYRGNFLGIPQHLGRIIVRFLHAAAHSGSTAQPLQPCSQHWFGESGLHFGVSNNYELPGLRIATGSGSGRGSEYRTDDLIWHGVLSELADRSQRVDSAK